MQNVDDWEMELLLVHILQTEVTDCAVAVEVSGTGNLTLVDRNKSYDPLRVLDFGRRLDITDGGFPTNSILG